MNITSYNIPDVSYHYIGLRVLDGVHTSVGRRDQFDAISRGVLKFVNDKALRLMLPEPRGTFETIGERVCQELVHLRLAHSGSSGYSLTSTGEEALQLLESREYSALRRQMIAQHLQTYDNFRAVLQGHINAGFIWRPIIDPKRIEQQGYIQALLEPTFGPDAASEALNGQLQENPKKVESILHSKVIRWAMPNHKVGVPLFRTICDRLASLRLLNIQRTSYGTCKFMKSYSPCVTGSPTRSWYVPLIAQLTNGFYRIYLCEPDMSDRLHQRALLKEIDKAFSVLTPEGGYYDIPQVRDLVCEQLMIPEPSFDDGINHLLDLSPSILSVGLRYERISGLRKPLVRKRQIVNLIRRV